MAELLFQMLSRVKSFKTGHWPYIELPKLCPYRLANLGYVVTQPFQLECYVCHHKVRIQPQFDSDYETTLVEVRKHKSNCIYFGDEEFQHLDIDFAISKESLYLLMDEIAQKLKQNFHILASTKQYPILNRQQIQKYLTEDMYTFKSVDQAYKLNWNQWINISFFLQFFGWTIQTQSGNINCQCLFCGREVALKQKKFINVNQQQKKGNYSQEESFSPVSEHRYFCLWVNSKCSSFKGYSIYLQYIFDKIIESKSLFSKRGPQQTKKIRVEMDKYLQSFQSKTSEQFEKIKAIFKEAEELNQTVFKLGDIQKTDKAPIFQDSFKKMKEFTNEFIPFEIRDNIKKIKLL